MRDNYRTGSEREKGATLDGKNMDKCFNSIQVCKFSKYRVNRLKIGHFRQIRTLKLHGHFFESGNLIP